MAAPPRHNIEVPAGTDYRFAFAAGTGTTVENFQADAITGSTFTMYLRDGSYVHEETVTLEVDPASPLPVLVHITSEQTSKRRHNYSNYYRIDRTYPSGDTVAVLEGSLYVRPVGGR
ncbi:hypothetical protein J2S43_003739 [Catenuloplanes nepalensis]|uniref:Uncharacterized protein n=1 Tax=Catenuloplanes nepalensis TaxID=587533 RepID=A0ABT9MUW2_9ACTN|nr:hypothetical protein [Catenuloplanes nepalensis]MDP9795227.1 hypothetical protein [Catenuloplanes nepalensis]